jgi:hypothetical protein
MLPVTAPCLIASVDSAPLDIGFVDAPPLDVVYVVHINVVIIVSAETVAVIGGDSVVIVVVVDVHVAVTPSTVVPPTPSPSGSQGNSDPERESAPGNVARVVKRRIRIGWGTKHHRRIVRRNINHLRVRLLDHNHLLTVVKVLRLNDLLGAGF